MILVTVILAGLAGWRVASLISREPGPWRIFSRLRSLLGVPDMGIQRGPFVGVFGCLWCMTAYTTAGAWGLYQVSDVAVGILAAWGLATIVAEGIDALVPKVE